MKSVLVLFCHCIFTAVSLVGVQAHYWPVEMILVEMFIPCVVPAGCMVTAHSVVNQISV